MRKKVIYPSLDFLTKVEGDIASGHPATEFHEGLTALYKRDYDKAAKIMTGLAKEGHQNAQFCLAGMYRDGEGVPNNPLKSYVLWRIVAQSDNTADVGRHASYYARRVAKKMPSSELEKAHAMLKSAI